MSSEINLFPVASWAAGPIKAYEAVTIRLDFLASPMQKPSEATTGRHYLLSKEQVHALISDLQKALQKLETSADAMPPGQRH